MVGPVAGLEGIDVDSLCEQVLVLLEWVVRGTEVVVWWTVGLLETREFLGLIHVTLDRVIEVLLRELTIVGHPVVERSRLVIPQVLEAAHVRVAEHEWHVGIPVVNSTQLLALKECLHVILHNWALGVGSVLSSSGLPIYAVTERENVVESLVLQGVGAHINHAIGARNA